MTAGGGMPLSLNDTAIVIHLAVERPFLSMAGPARRRPARSRHREARRLIISPAPPLNGASHAHRRIAP